MKYSDKLFVCPIINMRRRSWGGGVVGVNGEKAPKRGIGDTLMVICQQVPHTTNESSYHG